MHRPCIFARTLSVTVLCALFVPCPSRAFAGPRDNGAQPADPAASATGRCGTERWSVKTGTDPDAGQVDLAHPVPQTVAGLTALPAPSPLPANRRVKPTETTVFVVDGTLTGYKLESDSDYHLVLAGSQNRTMIAEIPDPACVGAASPFRSAVARARAEFDARYHATTSFKAAGVAVRVRGVGFFDFKHGQTGVAPNAIELHPVLDIAFNPAPGGGGSTGGGSAQLIANPGFEAGSATPWTLSEGVLCDAGGCSGQTPHAGTGFAWLDGYGSTHTDTLSQRVTLPAGKASATLTFWMHIDTAETTSTGKYDTLKLQLLDGSGQVIANLRTYSNLDAKPGYVRHVFNLSPYIGRTVILRFTGSEDTAKETSFVLDDVDLTMQ